MKSAILIMFCLIFFCCTKELKIDTSINVDTSMSANCLFHPDNSWDFQLVKTKSVDDSLSYESLDSAKITINDEWESSDFQFIPPSNTLDIGYYTNPTPEKNVKSTIEIYEVNIRREGYDDIIAIDTLPTKPLISNLEIGQISIQEIIFAGTAKRYIIDGNLTAKIENYDPSANYLVSITFENDYSIDLFGQIKDSLYSTNALIQFTNIDSEIYFNSFKGSQLNDPQSTMNLNFSHTSYKQQEIPSLIFVEISEISGNYYRYLQNLDQIRKVIQNPFSNQVVPYSNISGGYGIFAAYNSLSDTLTF